MASVALGNFDGVHIAHRTVLEKAARQGDSVCLLFDKHPLEVLQGKAPERLLDADKTRQKIAACGIERCVYLDFEALKDNSAEWFFQTVLLEQLHADHIFCGYNYSFGKNREGDVKTLARLCARHGVTLHVEAPVEFEGAPVSSSRIRHCLHRGEVEQANRMLGYNFFFESEVVQGKQLGRELGFPTMNQYLPEQMVKLRAGVYASVLTLEGKAYRALTNIGNNPTLGTDGFRSESYVFEYSGNAYGKTARVELLQFIREEQKFDTVQALKAQVSADIERAKNHV